MLTEQDVYSTVRYNASDNFVSISDRFDCHVNLWVIRLHKRFDISISALMNQNLAENETDKSVDRQ